MGQEVVMKVDMEILRAVERRGEALTLALKKQKASNKTEDVVRAGYAAGERVSKIAEGLGIHPRTVRKMASKMGISHPYMARSALTEREDEMIKDGYNRGLSLSEIARSIGASTSTVSVHATKKLGLRHPSTIRAEIAHVPREGCTAIITRLFGPIGPSKTCMWLHGEPRDMDYCGRPSASGLSWCDEHADRVFVRRPIT